MQFLQLPIDIIIQIFKKLSNGSQLQLSRSCKFLHNIYRDTPRCFNKLFVQNYERFYDRSHIMDLYEESKQKSVSRSVPKIRKEIEWERFSFLESIDFTSSQYASSRTLQQHLVNSILEHAVRLKFLVLEPTYHQNNKSAAQSKYSIEKWPQTLEILQWDPTTWTLGRLAAHLPNLKTLILTNYIGNEHSGQVSTPFQSLERIYAVDSRDQVKSLKGKPKFHYTNELHVSSDLLNQNRFFEFERFNLINPRPQPFLEYPSKTPFIFYAISLNRYSAVRWLLLNITEIHTEMVNPESGRTPFLEAIALEKFDIAKMLIEKFNSDPYAVDTNEKSALHFAMSAIKKIAPPEAELPLENSKGKQQTKKEKEEIPQQQQPQQPQQPRTLCIGSQMTLWLLSSKFNYNVNALFPANISPIVMACSIGEPAVVARLVEYPNIDYKIRDTKRRNCLHRCSLNPEILNILFQSVDPEILEVMANEVDIHGNTPLHNAAGAKCQQAVEILIDMGAKTNIKNLKRQTPESICKHRELKQILRGAEERYEMVVKQRERKESKSKKMQLKEERQH